MSEATQKVIGVKELPIPDLGTPFDFILAYSVFTHTTIENMRDLVGQLRGRLRPGGVLAFTFEEPEANLPGRLEGIRARNPALDVERLLRQSRDSAWCVLVHDERHAPSLFVEADGMWSNEAEHCVNYDVYHTPAFMSGEFPDAEIRPRVNGESMHCCIVRG